ncbi:MAG TPA: NUMOD3 domain-containing DNA-binding protein [Dehalococcoidia bacterium]|nr:NUMOD3 domain-containing DNA-binding protein [Dehalococcoidia bacterium]
MVWNKGLKGIHLSPATEFKVGHKPIGGAKKGHRPYLGFSGRKHTDETKQKMSLSAKGRGLTTEQRQKLSIALTGRCLSWEHRQKVALAMQGNQNRMGIPHSEEIKRTMSMERLGAGNGNWRGGASFLPYPIEFNNQLKNQIRLRDNYQCQKCGVPEVECIRKLSIHHIDYEKANCLSDNLISLCLKCSSEVNGNREYWQPFFNEKLNLLLAKK